MTRLTAMDIADWFGHALPVVASLVAGLLLGRFVDRVIVQLPAAMTQAWDMGAEEELSQDDPYRAGSSAATGGIPRPYGPPRGEVANGIAVISDQAIAAPRETFPEAAPAGDGWADPARAGRPASRSRRRAFVRLICGAAFAVLAARLGLGVGLLAALAATAVLIALAFIDWDHHLLPDILVLPLLGSGLLVNLAGLFAPPRAALLGALVGYGSLWLLARAYRLVFGRTGIGAGDLKLLAALGAWLGWQALLPLTQIAAGLALAATLAATLSRPRCRVPRQLPFGTYLAAAGWLLLVRPPM